MKVKTFVKRAGKNIVEFDDGSTIELSKDSLTDVEITFLELIATLQADLKAIKKKLEIP